MITEKNLTCIGCPMGCQLVVIMETGTDMNMNIKQEPEVLSVSGNTCPRGDAYARKEVTHPTRIVTSSLPVEGGTLPMVSCKTDRDIPKECIFRVTEAMRGVSAEAPIAIGDVLIADIAGCGANLIATRAVARKKA